MDGRQCQQAIAKAGSMLVTDMKTSLVPAVRKLAGLQNTQWIILLVTNSDVELSHQLMLLCWASRVLE